MPIDSSTKWESVLMKPLSQRGDYLQSENEIAYKQIAASLLGVFEDQEAFEEYLYLLANEESNGFECLFKGMNREIDNKRFQDIQNTLNIHEKQSLSINRFIAFMEGYNIFPFRKENFYPHFRNSFKQTLELFKKKYGSLSVPIFRRVIVDIIKWSWNHFNEWGKVYNFAERMPRILWYGDAKESEVYFLYFLYLFGCDVVVFHPEGKNIFTVLAENNITEVRYPANTTLFNFPDEKPSRRSTLAQKATNEINEVLYNDSTPIYRPWQLRDYIPRPITLKTTFEELFILQPEKAMFRFGFTVSSPIVEIPNLFTKIVGVSKDREDYWNKIHKISENPLIHTIKEFPVINKSKSNMQYHYQDVLAGDKIAADKLIIQSFWPYKNLATPLQKGLAEIISRFVYQAEINTLPHESLEEKRWYLFGQAMLLPEPIIQLFQQFDYSQNVPGVLVFNAGTESFTREDAVLLNLLNEMGLDVFLFNPTGQNDLEQFLDTKHYDVHWLEEMSFEEQFFVSSSVKSKLKTFLKKILK